MLSPVDVSAEGRRLIRDGNEVGYFQAYVPASMMPDTISRTSPYEVEAELVLENVKWEHVERGGKLKTSYINNHYLMIRSLSLVGDASAIAPAAAVGLSAGEGGTFDDVPAIGSGKSGKK